MKNSYEIPKSTQEAGAEQQKIAPAECVVVSGRGIEKVKIKTPDGFGEIWKPVGYVQKLDEKNMRTGKRKKNIAKEDKQTWLAGGTATTIAGIEMFEELKGTKPKLLIIAAGRPAYLENEPEGFSEGTIMKRILDRKVEGQHETVILDKAKNTQDNVIFSLEEAMARGLTSIAYIDSFIAMERTKEFYKLALKEHPEFEKIKVNFYTAEEMLERRYKEHPIALEEFNKIQEKLKQTGAYKHTSEREKIGVEKIKRGEYTGKKGNY